MKFYNLTELLRNEVELDPELMGGPLRYMYWILARQIFKGKAGFTEHMTEFVDSGCYCVQTKEKRREKRDRVIISLIRGTSDRKQATKEMPWKRFLEGLALCKVCNCTLEIRARKKLKVKTVERVRSASFNPILLTIENKVAQMDKVRGVGDRLTQYLANPAEAISDMEHPLGSLYWGMVEVFHAGPQWNRLMSEFISNPDNCVQLRFQRNDKYSNIKKAICNKACISWMRWCQAILALAIDEVEFFIQVTTRDNETYSVTHTVDMRTLSFIKED